MEVKVIRDLFETLFFIGGSILVWGKIGGLALAMGLTLYMCWRLIRWLTPMLVPAESSG